MNKSGELLKKGNFFVLEPLKHTIILFSSCKSCSTPNRLVLFDVLSISEFSFQLNYTAIHIQVEGV